MLNTEKIFCGSRVESERLAVGRVFSHPSPEGRHEVSLSVSGKSQQPNTALLCGEPIDSIPVWAGAPSVLKLESLLFPFDFSAASVQLLRWLTCFAKKHGAELTILHVVSRWMPPTDSEAPCPRVPNEERLETGRVLIRRLLRSVCERHESLRVHIAVGHPAEEILQFACANKPDAIVMANHGPRVLKHPVVSATTERVARQAPCPAVIVPEAVLARRNRTDHEDPAAATRRIVVPADFSSNSAAALRFAGALAEAQDAQLHVLNFSGASALPHPSRGRLDSWVQSNLPLVKKVTTTVCDGAPSAYMLVRQAELLKADLIVLGPRGYAWAERFRLNSTTDGILRNASCSVLSVRTGTHPAGH